MNRRVVLASRPDGIAQAENFRIEIAPVRHPGPGEIRVRNTFLSVEPAMRGWIADTGNYSAPVAIGEVMRSLAVGEVIESNDPGYAPGDMLLGWFGWQEEAVVDSSQILRTIKEGDLPASLALGVLGINGVTAYLALTGIGRPKAGETVLVSTAAGAVGSAAGQIAKMLGCRTVGLTSSADKVAQARQNFGYDEALDYTIPDLAGRIAKACPDGVDIYFDNTAGAISDAVYPNLSQGARVIVCGTASIAQWDPWPQGPRVERHLLVKRASMQGFVIFDYLAAWDGAVATLAGWVRSGQLEYSEDILEGLDACPDALAGVYRGENKGKRIIRL